MQYKNSNMFVDGTIFQTPGYLYTGNSGTDNANIASNISRINWNVSGKDFAVGINYKVYCEY